MQQIFRFIEKYRYFLLFAFLEFIALFFTIQSHSYHRSKFVNSANNFTGGLYKQVHAIDEFFRLKDENDRLAKENARLKNSIAQSNFVNDSAYYKRGYQYIPAKVYNNNYTKRNNYLTISKGSLDSIGPEMAVVNSRGIIGITKSVSKNFATVISVLNESAIINAKIKKNNFYGSLSWNGKDYKTVQLNDLPRETQISIGDTITTGGRSTIFPEGILIGTVANIEISNKVIQQVDVTLFNNMSSLNNIQVIKNKFKKEIEELEELNNE